MNNKVLFYKDNPIIIPSFSSKGNMLINDGEKIISDNHELILMLDKYLYHTYLISSYDVYYNLMPDNIDEYPLTDFLFVDSGGYEISDSYDLSEKYKYNYHICEWNIKNMMKVYQKIYKSSLFDSTKLVLTTFDCQVDLYNQIMKADLLKTEFPNATIDFLIKIKDDFTSFYRQFDQYKEELMKFSIIGITEKELGITLKDKLLNIIKVRSTMDSLGWEGSIHIFGGLEPNVLTLYFLAGANIFDGLSWQRVRFSNNSTLHNPNNYMIDRSEIDNKYWMMANNILDLLSLEETLRDYSMNNDMKKIRSLLCNILQGKGLYINQVIEAIGGI